MSAPIEALLELEEALGRDALGQEKERLLRHCQERAAFHRRALEAGLTPDDYRGVSELVAAYEAAQRVITVAWRRSHGPGAQAADVHALGLP